MYSRRETGTMPDMDSAFFRGNDEAAEGDLANAEVANLTNAVDDVLRSQLWDGSGVACVGLNLSIDNLRVDHGRFLLRGLEQKIMKLPCNKIWVTADSSTSIAVSLPPLNRFTFNDGGLWSDYLAGSEVVYAVTKELEEGGPIPLVAAELEEHGVGDFSLRLMCHPAKGGIRRGPYVKYSIIIFPLKPEQLEAYSPLTKNAAWPGLKIGDGEVPLLPLPSELWRCPVVPFIVPGTPLDVLGRVPVPDRLRRAVSSIMSNAWAPATARNAASLQELWEKLRRRPADCVGRPSPITWPAPSAEPPVTGKFRNNNRQLTLTHDNNNNMRL